jgi:hypothetical protein
MSRPRSHIPTLSIAILALALHGFGVSAAGPRQSGGAATTNQLHQPLDQILDLNVRDGLVYYRALRGERTRLDRYAASLNVPTATYEGWSREEKMAFWVNAYNVFVLQTVINNYPIRGRSSIYPSNSIRQISGAFDQLRHRVASRSLTLDDIEKTVLPEFKDPRVYLALGRGALGSGRLRSEAYTGARIGAQLDDIQAEFVTQQSMYRADRIAGEISVTPIMSWHEQEFVARYDTATGGPFAQRSPIERAIIAFITPHLLPLEKEFVGRNAFKVTFHTFDWRLNDLSGGRAD